MPCATSDAPEGCAVISLKLLGLLLTGSTGKHAASRTQLGWPDIHWLQGRAGGSQRGTR